MFDVGLPEIAVLIVAALFVFGPDRLPSVVAQAARTLRELRDLAAGARAEINDAIGPELREFNVMAQVAEIRDLNPRAILNNAMFGAADTLPAPVPPSGVVVPAGSADGTPASAAQPGTAPPGSGASGSGASGNPVFDADAT